MNASQALALTFTVPGKPCLNNRVYRHVGGKALKSAEAREYQARVKSIATTVIFGAFLRLAPRLSATMPISVAIVAFNCRGDIDSFAKCILDGMQGVVYVNDSCVKRLVSEKRKDKLGQRIVVTVTLLEVEP